jgi:dTDP-4-amino-4,6-dideoxygalactose transaminase
MSERVPFARPMLGEEEIAEVVDTLRSGWLTTGPKTKRFEEDFAAFTGAAHTLGTSACTGALHIGMAASGIGDGDEVIMPTMTFAATANVAVHCGARPVFVDVDAETLNIDPAAARAAITERTRAIFAVHFAGRPAALPALAQLCDERGLMLFEDAAHGIGASVEGRSVGTWGQFGGFSFYANKNMTTGEGGMLTTGSAELAAKARTLRLQGMTRDLFRRAEGALPSWRYEIVAAGFKYPMSDIQAALGLHQLRRLPGFQETRRKLVARYAERLAGVPGLTLPPAEEPGTVHAWHLYVVRVDPGARRNRDQLFSYLVEQGIDPSVHFVPLHLQPYFQEAWGARAGQFPRAEAAFAEILSLPLWPGMTEAQQDRVVAAIREGLR